MGLSENDGIYMDLPHCNFAGEHDSVHVIFF